MMTSSELPTIPEWFRGRRVFITGGSGFMGKVLVEKLLRSCPQLDTIYLLLRPKKGKLPSSRIQDITSEPLFNRLRDENPSALDKLVAVSGDVKELGLGLSAEDRRMVQQHVDVVFHSAASVRFDDPIRDAVLINVRGTREVLDLALGMDNLKVFLHVSTTFCNCDQPEVFEKIYPAPGDWRTMIKMAEREDNDMLLRCLTPKILGKLPNTYTYAKALGEQVIKDYQHQIPVVIVRPSIVICCLSEPLPGWIDNFNGPFGLIVGNFTGLLRSLHVAGDIPQDFVPVDVAIKAMIFIAWHRALLSAPHSLPVYNCSSILSASYKELSDVTCTFLYDIPFSNTLWNPNPTFTTNLTLHYLKVIFFHMLPALLFDGLLKLNGKKPTIVKLQRRIHVANTALKVFTLNHFIFNNTFFLSLQEAMLPADLPDFSYKEIITDWHGFMYNCILGARTYLLNEPLTTLPDARIHFNRLYWLDRVMKTLLLVTALWITGAYNLLRNTLPEMTVQAYHNMLD